MGSPFSLVKADTNIMATDHSSDTNSQTGFARLVAAPGGGQALALSGDWVIDNAPMIDAQMASVASSAKGALSLDVSGIGRLDTTGTILVRRYASAAGEGVPLPLNGAKSVHVSLFDTITCCPPPTRVAPHAYPWHQEVMEDIGIATIKLIRSGGTFMGFLGVVLIRIFGLFLNPKRLRFTSLVRQIEEVGFKSLGIVGLISLLIGAVTVNQGAIQFARFGADIFVIDMIGIGQLRELGILLTAIIIAGRSGSAFTAQIGSMKLHEEVDAMETIGMNPIDVLVVPRVLALMIALPLLTFYADILGLTGGAFMAWGQLGITPANFLFYLRDAVPVENLYVGIIKAPFFAAVIAISGCFEGLSVHHSAESLGQHTTRSVVQSIILVMALDALFALFFTAIDM